MSTNELPCLEKGDGTNVKIDPSHLPMVIGRANECEITVNDNSISRRHAQITISEDSYFLEDLGSRNGTTLNNARIHKRTRIQHGDRIQICDSVFVFKQPQRTPTARHPTPIMVDDHNSGLSSIMSRMEMGSTMGSSIGSALGSVNHSGSLDSEGKLEMLMHITRTLNRSLSLDETLQRVLDYLFEIFGNADRGVIVLTDPHGHAEPLATKVRGTVVDKEIKVSSSILKYVMGNKQSVLSHDVESDDRIDTEHSLANVPIRSVMSVPLIDSEDNAIGMIQLDTTYRQQAFNQSDLELLTNVSIQSGMAIENSRLVDQLVTTKLVTQEMEMARGVQENLLPKEVPQIDGYCFHQFYRPMLQIGGDYYDYLRLDHDRIAIILGDVVGHGIPAALLMAKLSSECRMGLQSRETLATIAHRVNESFALLPPDQYATLTLTILDHRNHRLEVMNAGHLPTLRRQPNGEVEEICPVRNFAIGLYSDAELKGGMEFECFQFDIGPGDCIYLHTDGLNEAMNEDKDEYTRERVLEQLSCPECSDPEAAVDRLIADVGAHAGNTSQHDDICIVGFRREK